MLHNHQVVLSGMEYFLNFGISKDASEWRHILQGDGINQEIFIRGGELDQADAFLVCKQAVRFGVYGDDRLLFEESNDSMQGVWFSNENRGGWLCDMHERYYSLKLAILLKNQGIFPAPIVSLPIIHLFVPCLQVKVDGGVIALTDT